MLSPLQTRPLTDGLIQPSRATMMGHISGDEEQQTTRPSWLRNVRSQPILADGQGRLSLIYYKKDSSHDEP
jgi:hypothetical protein